MPEANVEDLTRRIRKLTSILDVAKAMTAERDLDPLLALILSEAAKVIEADRCSLFLIDRERQELWSKIAQGASGELRLPLGSGIAGAVAQTGTTINIPDAYAEERFNRSFDLDTGYRTRSILCVPMRDAAGDITGVIEGLNKKDGPFTVEDEELLLAIGGQAAVAIENAVLHDDIRRLFEGFVSASVVAIEARDPSTAGHSSRVSALTLALARSLEAVSRGPYAGTCFSTEELQEIRYASMLHDFGKVGVREAVLVKAKKLHPQEMELLGARFALARKDFELQSHRRRRLLSPALLKEEEDRLEQQLRELDRLWAFIQACNEPTVLNQGTFERLTQMAQVSFLDEQNRSRPILSTDEVQALSIPRGSLSALERREIESHVTHTFRFLSMIPWTPALRNVPIIAHAHHEKLDGTGYPRGIFANQIPVQSRMMAISDIYDALTAADRPYKHAVPHVKAIDILRQEAAAGHLDRALLRIFIEAQIPGRAGVSPQR